jgi:hypothetical protein
MTPEMALPDLQKVTKVNIGIITKYCSVLAYWHNSILALLQVFHGSISRVVWHVPARPAESAHTQGLLGGGHLTVSPILQCLAIFMLLA